MTSFGFNIGKFLSEIGKSGVAHNHRYEVEFSSSRSGVSLVSREEMEKMNNRLETISFPAANIGSKGQFLQGIEREMPYGRLYEGDIELTFLEDSTYEIRKVFTRWQNKIIDNQNFTCGYYNDYVCDVMTITTYTQTDKKAYSVSVYDVFAKNVNAIELSTSGDTLVKTVVSLSFRRWTDGTESPASEESSTPIEETQKKADIKRKSRGSSALSALGPRPGPGF